MEKHEFKSLHNVSLFTHDKELISALAGVAQWIEHWPVNQRVASSIPS